MERRRGRRINEKKSQKQILTNRSEAEMFGDELYKQILLKTKAEDPVEHLYFSAMKFSTINFILCRQNTCDKT